MTIGFGLLQGVFKLFRMAIQGKDKMGGIGFLYLEHVPILDFEDGQTGVPAIEDEIRFAAFDVRQVPGSVFAVRFGGGLQESVELTFPVCTELVNVVRDHDGHAAFSLERTLFA